MTEEVLNLAKKSCNIAHMEASSQAQSEDRPSPTTLAAPRLVGFDTLISELYARSAANSFAVTLVDFANILAQVVAAQGSVDAPEVEIRNLLNSLRIEELALARACAAGNERAWEVFLNRYREALYSAATSVARDDVLGRELADSLYADLFGTEAPGGVRASKLNSYLGIGSLQGWLRTILAHIFIDRYRTDRPLVSLSNGVDGEDSEDLDLPAPPQPSIQPVDPRVGSATDEALQSLDSEDSYLLSSWFIHGRTLAELGRALGVHESTISRRIDKIVAGLRKKISAGLVRRGMTRRQAQEALEIDIRDLEVNVGQRLEENLQDRGKAPSFTQGPSRNPRENTTDNE